MLTENRLAERLDLAKQDVVIVAQMRGSPLFAISKPLRDVQDRHRFGCFILRDIEDPSLVNR